MKATSLTRTMIAIFAAAAVAASPAAAARKSRMVQPAGFQERIARVENGLLPAILIAGREAKGSPLAERMSALKVPGVSIAVIDDGAVAWAKSYGVVETGSTAPVTPRTLFQAASISKSVAALGAMRLVDQGKLILDEDVNAKLRSWKVPENELTKTEKVTLKRLLSHTAGLTVHGFGGYAAGEPVPSVPQILDGLKPANSAAVRADVVPGSLWRYSGGGFTVMQQLLVDATGRPFPDLLDELVLEPLGMADSTYEQPLPSARLAAASSGHDGDGRLIPGRSHTYPEMAAAGLWTTPSDLARFLIELRRGLRGESPTIPAATAKAMTTTVKSGYGLGLSLQGFGPSAAYGHGGSNEGFKCQMIAYVEKGQGAVIMTNGDGGSRLAGEILRAVAREYGWPTMKAQERKVVAVAPEALALLVGRYQMRPDKILSVVLEGGTLFVIDGSERIELYPESETRFFELTEETTVFFQKGADGKPKQLVIDGRIFAPRIVDR
jgi:CubicO group peptidase (beta-lactamase class C family)